MTSENLCVVVPLRTGASDDTAGGLVDRAGSTQGLSDEKEEMELWPVRPKRPAVRTWGEHLAGGWASDGCVQLVERSVHSNSRRWSLGLCPPATVPSAPQHIPCGRCLAF